jgi:hypothetical protein
MKTIEKKANTNAKKFATIFMLLIAVVIIISIIASPDKDEYSITFQEIGYYTAPNHFRVYTFYVSDTNFSEIRKHGDQLFRSEDCATVAFYYTDRDLCRNMLQATDFYNALKIGYQKGCIAEYFNDRKGEVRFTHFPSYE